MQGFLVHNFTLILHFQAGDFLFAHFLPHPEPGSHHCGQAKGELPIQVDVNPLGILLLGFNRRNPLYHVKKRTAADRLFWGATAVEIDLDLRLCLHPAQGKKDTDKLSGAGNESVTAGGKVGKPFVF
jgi:hypothetical protein